MSYKANSKEVIKNVREYISDNFDTTNWGLDESQFPTFEDKANFIYQDFRSCYYSTKEDFEYWNYNQEKAFCSWLQGLPSVINSADYIYRRYHMCTDIVGDMFNQTEQERSKYSNSDAMNLLSRLIYREIMKGVEKYEKIHAKSN